MATRHKISTWADAFGIWHARVDFDPWLGNDGESERAWDNGRRAARRAIRRELDARANVLQGLSSARVRVSVVENKQTAQGWTYSTTFAECST